MRQESTAFAHAAAGQQRPPGGTGWLLLAPLLCWVVAFVVAPAAIMLVYSFLRRGTLGGVVWEFTLDNYAAVADPTYFAIIVRSIVFAAITTLLCLGMGYPVAYLIGRASEERRNLLLMLVMVPFWTSFLIRTYAWVTILKSQGLLNSILLGLGAIGEPLELLYTRGAVILGLVYTFLPFMILPIYSSVEKLDGALIEAALDLGAGPLRAFARVIVPLTQPGIAAGVLLVFVPALGLYAVNDILGGGRVDMIGNVIENQFKGNARNWPFGAALGTAMLVAFGLTYWVVSRRQRAVEFGR
ncbi:MAG TPA: ABC transporter permease [Candidatus Limnocylindria bacterium]|nr:ABC transporter permease [Candidatus Limnocylindria bacterium]